MHVLANSFVICVFIEYQELIAVLTLFEIKNYTLEM